MLNRDRAIYKGDNWNFKLRASKQPAIGRYSKSDEFIAECPIYLIPKYGTDNLQLPPNNTMISKEYNEAKEYFKKYINLI